MGKLIFMWAPVSPHHLPCLEYQEPLELSDSDNINEAVDTKLLSLLNLRSRDVEGAEVVVASDLFYVNCGPGLLEAGGVIVDGLNWHL